MKQEVFTIKFLVRNYEEPFEFKGTMYQAAEEEWSVSVVADKLKETLNEVTKNKRLIFLEIV
jgi:hypothetical protein